VDIDYHIYMNASTVILGACGFLYTLYASYQASKLCGTGKAFSLMCLANAAALLATTGFAYATFRDDFDFVGAFANAKRLLQFSSITFCTWLVLRRIERNERLTTEAYAKIEGVLNEQQRESF